MFYVIVVCPDVSNRLVFSSAWSLRYLLLSCPQTQWHMRQCRLVCVSTSDVSFIFRGQSSSRSSQNWSFTSLRCHCCLGLHYTRPWNVLILCSTVGSQPSRSLFQSPQINHFDSIEMK